MRTGTLRPADTAFSRRSEVTAAHKQGRRTRAPVGAELIAIHSDDDWFALFADEKDLAPRAAMPTKLEPSKGEPINDVAPETGLPIQLPELAWIRPDAPPWLRYALVRWHFGPWPVIAGAAGIILGAGVLLFAARSLGGPIRPAPADSKPASASIESSSLTTTPLPTAARTFPAADASALLAPAPAPNAPPAVRSATRSDRADISSRRAVVPPQPARPVEGTRAKSIAPASARPTATPTPTPTATPIPTPTPTAAPPQTWSDAPGGHVSPPPPPAAPSRPSESALIRSLLDLYRQAYSSLDVNAVAGVWPSVNTRSLARAFSQLESQKFEFTDCRINVSAARAEAICTGRASFVPKIGGRATRSENREWAFVLERLNDGWIISRADSR